GAKHPRRFQHRHPASSFQVFEDQPRHGSASVLRSSHSTICRTLCLPSSSASVCPSAAQHSVEFVGTVTSVSGRMSAPGDQEKQGPFQTGKTEQSESLSFLECSCTRVSK